MYSRSYNTSNIVPPNYNGTSINPDTADEITEKEIPYARVPLMDMPVYKQHSKPESVSEPEIAATDEIAQPMKKIAADDILLIGLLIILLGCENVDMKLIIAVAVLLFVGF
jgi:hypothetical protein